MSEWKVNNFEKSQFCQNYGCILAGRFEGDRGIDNAYQIKNYPVYNDFLVEITTNSDRIIDFGISLDPKQISSNELQLIRIFLTSFLNNKTLNSDVMDFVQQNINQSVFQICESRSIQFDLMHLWVGNIGGVPTILVAKNCPR